MEEKIFGLLGKIYIEMQDMKSKMITKDNLFNIASKEVLSSLKQDLETRIIKNAK